MQKGQVPNVVKFLLGTIKEKKFVWSLDVETCNVKTDLNQIVYEGVIHPIYLTKNGI